MVPKVHLAVGGFLVMDQWVYETLVPQSHQMVVESPPSLLSYVKHLQNTLAAVSLIWVWSLWVSFGSHPPYRHLTVGPLPVEGSRH